MHATSRLPHLAWALLTVAAAACGPEGGDASPSGVATLPDRVTSAGAPADTRLVDPLRPAMELVGEERFEEAFALADAYGRLPGAVPYQAEFMRGYARHKAQRYAAAREHFERAVALAPDYHPTWHFLGFACHALGDLDRAEEAFREHARRSPGEADDAFGLAIVALDRDDLAGAREQLDVALRLHQEQADRGVDRRRELAKVYARLGDVHARSGDWEAARTALQQAVQQFSGHDEIWHKLAEAHQRLGEDQRAAEARAVRDQVRASEGGS